MLRYGDKDVKKMIIFQMSIRRALENKNGVKEILKILGGFKNYEKNKNLNRYKFKYFFRFINIYPSFD